VAGIASAHASNEELFAFRCWLDALGTEAAGVAVLEGDADDLLVAKEKAPNARGARALGFQEAEAIVERIRGGGVDGLVVFGSELLDESLLGGSDTLERLDTVIVIDRRQSLLQRVAQVVLPARHPAESFGTFTNLEGRVQRFRPAVQPAFEAHDLCTVAGALGRALGFEGFADAKDWEPLAVSRRLAAEIPAFEGLDWNAVGDAGLPLADPEAGA
jgi:NADH-quinone oxidoreductase subunit G